MCAALMTIPAIQPLHVRLTLQARHQPSWNDIPTRRCWTVDVLEGNEKVTEDLQLSDPLSKEEAATCRWYLEQYVQSSPFSISQARAAEALLKGYPKNIINQLNLREILQSRAPSINGQPTVLSLLIKESINSPDATVHQLHWEALEDPECWNNPNLRVEVKRAALNKEILQKPLARVKTRQDEQGATGTLNILLVVARDTSHNPAIYSDVNPFLVSDILSQIRKNLRQSEHAVRMNVEIVRPGSLKSLEEHLQRAEAIHGTNYFHIIHFDLHGKVGLRKKGPTRVKNAFLYFCDPHSNATRAESATKVGKILKRHSVPLVVLNACESARANCGDDANIAKIFEQEGVQKVLAMSFKISSSAANLFLSKFYNEFLITGTSFSRAAAEARSFLRTFSIRQARFGLELPLKDWFVPVIYGSDHDVVIRQEKTPGEDSVDRGIDKPFVSTAKPDLSTDSTPVGREFDILRIEKLLCQNHTLYLHGPPGSGKSALIRYLASVWKETSFVDGYVYVDFKNIKITQANDFIENIASQLVARFLASNMNLWTVNTLSVQSYDHESLKDIIKSIVKEYRVAMIFDNIQVSHSNIVPMSLDDVLLTEINNFLSPFLDSPGSNLSANITTTKPFVLFIGRRSDVQWISNIIGYDFLNQHYKISGLELPDAIELAQSTLRDAGENLDEWQHEDFNTLELVLELLQRIPDAILQVLPMARRLRIPWREFHHRVHTQLISSTEARRVVDENNDFHKEFRNYEEILPHVIFPYFLLLGFFWREGPIAASLVDAVISIAENIGTDSATEDQVREAIETVIRAAMLFARDRGLLEYDNSGRINWIHPLFTLYSKGPRLAQSDEECPEDHKRDQSIAEKEVVEDDSPTNFQSMSIASILPIIKTIEERAYLQFMVNVYTGSDYSQLRIDYSAAFPNLLTCIKHCIVADDIISLNDWPMTLFTLFAPHIRLVGTTTDCILFADAYEQLLSAFFRLNKGYAVPEKYQTFAFNVINYLTVTHRAEVKLISEDSLRFSNIGMSMIEQTEAKYGRIVDQFQKSLVYRYRTFIFLDKGMHSEARACWHNMTTIDDVLFGSGKERLIPPMENREVLKESMQMINILAKTEEEKAAMKSRLDAKPGYAVGAAFYKSRKKLGHIIDLLCAGESLEVDGPNGSTYIKWLNDQSQELQKIHGVTEAVGMRGLEMDERWWPENFDMVKQHTTLEDPSHRLSAIEEARDTGNWADAAEQHQGLLLRALQEVDFEEVLVHIRSLIAIYRRSPIFAMKIKEIIGLQKFIEALAPLYENFVQLLENRTEKAVEENLRLSDRLVHVIREVNPSEENLQITDGFQDLWKRSLQGPASIRFTKEWLQETFRKHLRNLRKPGYQNRVIEMALRFKDIYRRMIAAEDAHDYETCLEVLDYMDELTDGELESDFFTREEVERDREMYKWKRDYWALSDGLGDAIVENEFDIARECLRGMKDLLCARDVSLSQEKGLYDLYELIERMHWNHEWQKVISATKEHRWRDAVRICSTLEMLSQDGLFDHLKNDPFRTAKSTRLMALYQQSDAGKDWDSCLKYCDDWVELNADKLKDNPRAHDLVISMHETAEMEKYNTVALVLDQQCEFERALKHFEILEKIFQRQQQTPEVKRTSVILLPKVIADMRSQLESKVAMMQLMGPTLGKQWVLSVREKIGYTPQYKPMDELKKNAHEKLFGSGV
ncbi:hypothetical protein M501DRAFT_988587 [Patellaria atrata CBS 101060]|uniref:CHAT domain-containing protein n=1 Tax=Patellaria atrata CBS 101060 TaxID=1346257 RepID=A0A9P4SG93_9PEZI|nr:hypothetical protein M501DRAFT_988587 [Patellaria atrata CBS 101060]